jgi:hypothetical protein
MQLIQEEKKMIEEAKKLETIEPSLSRASSVKDLIRSNSSTKTTSIETEGNRARSDMLQRLKAKNEEVRVRSELVRVERLKEEEERVEEM